MMPSASKTSGASRSSRRKQPRRARRPGRIRHTPTVTCGWGWFIIKRRDEEIALRVLNTCLVDERGPRPSGSGWNINGPTGYDLGFSFTRESLLYYREPSKHEKRQMLKGKS